MIKYLLIFVFLLISPVAIHAQDDGCPATEPQSLVIGEQGQVTPGAANRVRSEPSTSGEIVFHLDSGAVFEVVDGPVCGEGYRWWKVSFNGQEGWTVEGDDSGYFLEPITQTEIAETETPAPESGECGLEPTLEVGREGKTTSNTPSRLRDLPSANGAQIGQIQPLDTFKILEGPVCEGGIHWWKVSVGTLEGWTAEGVDGEYFIEMLPFVATEEPCIPFATPGDIDWQGKQIAIGTDDGVWIYNAEDLTEEPLHLLAGAEIDGLAFNPADPTQIAVIFYFEDDNNGMDILDIESGEFVTKFSQPRPVGFRRDVKFTDDGEKLIYNNNGTISIYDLEADISRQLPAPNYTSDVSAAFSQIDISANGESIGGAYNADSSIILAGPFGGALTLIEGMDIPEQISAYAFNDDGTRFATGGANGNVRMWTLPDFEYSSFIRGEQRSTTSNFINEIAFNPVTGAVVTAEGDPRATVRVFDGQSLTQVNAYTPTGTTSSAAALVFSPDGSQLAVVVDNSIQILETEGYTLTSSLVLETCPEN